MFRGWGFESSASAFWGSLGLVLQWFSVEGFEGFRQVYQAAGMTWGSVGVWGLGLGFRRTGFRVSGV